MGRSVEKTVKHGLTRHQYVPTLTCGNIGGWYNISLTMFSVYLTNCNWELFELKEIYFKKTSKVILKVNFINTSKVIMLIIKFLVFHL